MPQKVSGVLKNKRSDLEVIQSLYDKGQFRKVMFRAKQAIKLQPDHVGLHALAGFSAQKLGEGASADELLTKAVRLAQTGDATSLNLPQALAQLGRWSMALPLFVSFLKKNPTHAQALNGAGCCLVGMGDVDKAIVLLSDALKYAPDEAAYASDLGEAFGRTGQDVLALQCYDIAYKLAPGDLEHVMKCAKTAYDLGELEVTVGYLDAGLGQWPDNPGLLSNYATTLNALGRIEDAIVQWRKVMDLHPSYSISYSNFASKKRIERIEDFSHRLDQQLSRRLSRNDEMHIRIAKVDLHEERREYGAAYENLLIANRLRLADSAWSIEETENVFERIKGQFSEPAEINSRYDAGGVTPIFILGMPRSGTSLTEAILGRHSDVMPRGELKYLTLLVNQMDMVGQAFGSDQASRLAEAYMVRLRQSGSRPFITDKMPDNYRLIGHIAMAMPNARIVHVRRDPRACCWSNFRTYFSTDQLEYSYDTDSLIRYFELYQDLMAFWHERFPGRIIDVDYEALTADPDAEIPTLIQSLGLEWQEDCLAPQDSGNVVRTASQEQVRKKIYKGSAQGWRKYEAQAGGWLSRLPDHQPNVG